jgi:hypothetical protein
MKTTRAHSPTTRSAASRGWSRLRIWLAGLLLAAGAFACVTPSVPLPPPLLSSLQFTTAATPGFVEMKGAPTSRHANVRFYIYNISKGDGAIAQAAADGSFTSDPFMGAGGDTVELYYDEPGGDRSEATCVQLQLTGSLVGNTCE